MPLQATSGAASYDAFGGGVPVVPAYIEEVFSTYLYTGNGSTQTITNNIDLSTKGGLVWIKERNGTSYNVFTDTVRGVNSQVYSNATNSANSNTNGVTAFNSTGFNLGNWTFVNFNTQNFASWTFRKQPKFFDVVTYTGTGANNRTIAHALTSTPGCIIVKRTDSTGDWYVYHRGVDPTLAYGYFMVLNTTAARAGAPAVWDGAPTSTTFTIQDLTTNINGATYVAYLFAHNAGGFGLTGTDNVISCGSYTGNGSTNGPTVNLGYEPQWVLVKNATGSGNPWNMDDNMRGWETGGLVQNLQANASYAESQQGPALALNSTGFKVVSNDSDWNGTSATYIYIAIRRGPMKVPTLGTSVFAPVTRTGTGATAVVTTPNFVVDSAWIQQRTSGWQAAKIFDRLRGATNLVYSNTTSAGVSEATTLNSFASNVGFTLGDDSNNYSVNRSGEPYINYAFRRAPSFFDEVCYTGDNVFNRAIPHNLAAVPELVIVKNRTTGGSYWAVYTTTTGSSNLLKLNLTNASASNPYAWGSTAASSTNFYVGDDFNTNNLSDNFVMYLFATCAGVSKVFSFTGNGSSQTINCGFTAGSRWVMIKRTDSTGDWYVWDSARGIVAGNDPHLSLNSTAAEVTTDDSVDTDSTGFIVNQLSATNVNVTSATYIGIAIA